MQIHLQRIVGSYVGSAYGAGQFYSKAVTEAKDATAKLANDIRDEDLDGPVGFDSNAQRKREFAADMGLQSHALRMAAEGAIAAYEHIVGEAGSPTSARSRTPARTSAGMLPISRWRHLADRQRAELRLRPISYNQAGVLVDAGLFACLHDPNLTPGIDIVARASHRVTNVGPAPVLVRETAAPSFTAFRPILRHLSSFRLLIFGFADLRSCACGPRDGRDWRGLEWRFWKMSRKENKPRVDIYAKITDRIVADLEKGVRPWVKPWSAGNTTGQITRPLRHNGLPYQGINTLLLWSEAVARSFVSPTWMTFKQSVELGGHVRKGETGSMVVYASRFTRTETDARGELERGIPFLKAYTVFCADQIEDLPAQYYGNPAPVHDPVERVEHADAFFANTGR